MEPGYDVFEYSRKGLLKELREALQMGSRPDQFLAYDGSTALVMAARGGHANIVRELLSHGASVNTRTEEGSTLLSHAVSGRSVEAVEEVLKLGVLVDEPNEEAVTPLMLAAHYGPDEVVLALCKARADVNSRADGWGTVLDCAAGSVVELLVAQGAKRSAAGGGQPIAAAAERFGYGCFDTGENPHATPIKAPAAGVAHATPAQQDPTPGVGDTVRLRHPKSGLLKEGELGVVVADDGSDCVPLKVQVGEGYDYYEYRDVVVCRRAEELPFETDFGTAEGTLRYVSSKLERVKPSAELQPDTDKATAEGTLRYVSAKLEGVKPSVLSSTGLSISPVGFGCHRMESSKAHKDALRLAIQLGCNFIDLAPNYTDGMAEQVVGEVLAEMLDSKQVRRDEVVIATKVGNVLGQQMAHAEGRRDMSVINDSLWHCISPEWIEQELTRSLSRLRLKCIDCLLLHCPECETKAEGVAPADVYVRMKEAFQYLEKEVSRGRIAMYGVSAAFYPLRPADPEHLDLNEVMKQLPSQHHFRVLQFPLNFAEAQTLWVSHTPRNPGGDAVNKELAQSASTLFEAARNYGLATLINRPLDGIYKESPGILRFSSLDCAVRAQSELQLDNCDSIEEKITRLCLLDNAPFHAGEGASGQLAAKTVKVLLSLEGVDCVLLGMRQPSYVVDALPLAFGTPQVPPETAAKAMRAVYNTVDMWFATAIHELDHGTAKDWRLPISQKYNGP